MATDLFVFVFVRMLIQYVPCLAVIQQKKNRIFSRIPFLNNFLDIVCNAFDIRVKL